MHAFVSWVLLAVGVHGLQLGRVRATSRADGAVYSPPRGADSQHSSLSITIPGGSKLYAHSDALFGIPSYGGGLAGRLYYPLRHDPSGCDVGNLTSDGSVPPQSIFLLDRGGCPFTVKVLAAQAAGAVGVVIIDNLGVCGTSPECGREACSRCPLYGTETCQCTLPYLGDDTGGVGVTVPSMMVGRADGAALREPASVGKGGPAHAVVVMRWAIPSPDDRVEWTLYHSPNDPSSKAFRDSMAPYLPYVLPRSTFTPVAYIFDGRALGCSGPDPVFDCKSQCTNEGFYCALDPDGDLDGGVSGADVVLESIRSTCAAQQAASDTPVSAKWWQYSDAFQATCGALAWTPACSYGAMTAAGLDAGEAEECARQGNATVDPGKGDWTNTLLQAAINAREGMGIVTLPSVVVNGVVLRGGTQPSAVLSALCAGYASGSAPPICSCLTVPVDGIAGCVATASGASTPPPPPALPTWAGVLIAFTVLGTALALAGTAFHHLHSRRLNADVVALMDDYRALVDEAEEPGGEGGARGPSRKAGPRGAPRARGAGAAPPLQLSTWLSALLAPPPSSSSTAPFATSASGLRGATAV